MAYHRYHGVDTRIVRIFNTFGPRMRPNDGRVVSNLIVQALGGESPTIYGDGSRTRNAPLLQRCNSRASIEGDPPTTFTGRHAPRHHPRTLPVRARHQRHPTPRPPRR